MQRRVAALYAAFFLVVALGSYGMLVTASEPAVSVQNPDYTAANGSQLTVDGRTYDVSAEGGSATLSWLNESATYTETWENESSVTLGETNFTVRTEAQADPPRVQLTEEQSLGENVTTTEVNGTEYVVQGEGEQRTLISVEEYRRQQFGPPETRTIAAGDTFDYRGNQTTLTAVSNGSATVEWTAPRTEEIDASEGDALTLNGNEFVAHFPDAQTLALSRDVQAYRDQVAVRERFHERTTGLMGVSLLSGLTVILLLSFAYLPSRY